jgi:Ca2+-binding RTX toxin-like protein
MPVTATSTTLESIIRAIQLDPGLKGATPVAEINAGIAAARQMNEVLGEVIEKFNYNADGLITEDELMKISAYVRATPLLHYNFIIGHGNDEGTVETGFHKIQNDGSTLQFQGRNMINTVIDAIYHYGEEFSAGRFVNEDGNQNEKVVDVAGWLNYFLNGQTTVFGSDGNDVLGSGDYSAAIASAANETFMAGAGNDKIWAHTGDDKVYAGTGDDESGGGTGNDQMWGEDGADKLYGEEGADQIWGGAGNDQIGGGLGDDKLFGDAGDDKLWGDEGNDVISGGDGNDVIGGGTGLNTLNGDNGNDEIHGGASTDRVTGGAGNDTVYGNGGNDDINGGDGNDTLNGGDGFDFIFGGAGNDSLSGGEGADRLRGGLGADTITLWDSNSAVDTVILFKGESGRTTGTIDIVEGFTSGEDKIDLRMLGKMTFEDLDYSGNGASCYYDGRYLRIDENGDRATDMIVSIKWVDDLNASDLLLA